ncbi:MAG: succinate dehydrogenase/fumarate reductase iron-sulfur subunit [Thermoplasmata archaeon]|nr:MAG: succinate dehydrogenase/fumarate reductase iron-sulfur subunit [Thermoplasmata archaeon]
MRLKVLRFDPATKQSKYETFGVKTRSGMTVLEALFYAREEYDDSLAFRYSCRGAVCGICAVRINKVPRLACRTQVSSLLEGSLTMKLKPYPAIENKEEWDQKEVVLVEPIPHLPVIKDLVVDRTRFFHYYRSIEPVFKPRDQHPQMERLMKPSSARELEKYTNCILCAACVGACPVNGAMRDYLGPAILAKLYRFYIDPREGYDDSRLLIANKPNGWWGCQFHANCKRVCPKDVPPNIAIGKARKKLKELNKVPPEIEQKE